MAMTEQDVQYHEFQNEAGGFTTRTDSPGFSSVTFASQR